MNRFTVALFGAAMLAGCQDNGLSELENINLGAAPVIEVRPLALDFGTVEDNGQEIRQFVVTNIGDATLHVDSIDLVADAGFTILTEELNFTLEPIDEYPDAVKVVDVAFTPVNDDVATGQALVNSDDEVNSQVSVSLTGSSSAPWLTISPDPHDFGTQYVGIECLESQVITLTNEGLEDLVISGIAHNDASGLISMTQSPTLPLTLAPGQASTVTVEFDAFQSGNAEGTLEVTSNDPRGIVSAMQYADTQYALTTTDTFTQPTEVPVDILFAIDQSCSMDDRLANLQANFDTFINTISGVTNDWRIGVSTLAGGCFNNNSGSGSLWIDQNTPNYAGVFNWAVVEGYETTNSEKLFTQAIDSLTAGCNAGFMRNGALLHVVLVSDEAEQGTISPSSFVSQVETLKGTSSLVKVSGIVCPEPRCNTIYTPDTAVGYAEAITLGGGVRLNIMSNSWGQQVEDLASASLTGIGRYELTQTADPNATEVLVNGQTWTGWYYDSNTNSIVFTDTPPAGATITVNYGVAINCN
ncbi:MAG: choice-of-anchor D domain-containing protein [Deltaproteobacteria bacterium]|nr:MAG: choice-of-anchor D domain-containing protein [Deltaproteobacteria bacterium]